MSQASLCSPFASGTRRSQKEKSDSSRMSKVCAISTISASVGLIPFTNFLRKVTEATSRSSEDGCSCSSTQFATNRSMTPLMSCSVLAHNALNLKASAFGISPVTCLKLGSPRFPLCDVIRYRYHTIVHPQLSPNIFKTLYFCVCELIKRICLLVCKHKNICYSQNNTTGRADMPETISHMAGVT